MCGGPLCRGGLLSLDSRTLHSAGQEIRGRGRGTSVYVVCRQAAIPGIKVDGPATPAWIDNSEEDTDSHEISNVTPGRCGDTLGQRYGWCRRSTYRLLPGRARTARPDKLPKRYCWTRLIQVP